MVNLIDSARYNEEIVPKIQRSPVWNNSKSIDELLLANENDTKNNRKLKTLLRNGVPNELRCIVWTKMLQIFGDQAVADYEQTIQNRNLAKIKPSQSRKYPTFGGVLNQERLALNEAGLNVVKNILSIIAFEFPHLEFCPFLPNLVALFLHQISPDDTLSATRVIIQESISSREFVYIPTTLSSMTIFYEALGDLISKKTPKVHKHLTKLGDKLWIRWINAFLLDILSLHTAFRMMDSFLLEGYKIIFRYIVSALLLRGPAILNCSSVLEVDQLFEKNHFSAIDEEDEKLSDAAFNFSFSRNSVNRFYREEGERILSSTNSDVETSPRPDLYLETRTLPNYDHPSTIIKDVHWEYVWSWIPKKYRQYDVEMIFDVSKHGYNLKTMYKLCAYQQPQLLFIETTTDELFGAFLSEPWENNLGKKFFGTAETFLFSLKPADAKYEWAGFNVKPEETDRLREISENGSMFIFGNNQYMAIGGGGVHYGISIDDQLQKGTSGACKTFNNPPLGGKSTFEVRQLEVWTFKS